MMKIDMKKFKVLNVTEVSELVTLFSTFFCTFFRESFCHFFSNFFFHFFSVDPKLWM